MDCSVSELLDAELLVRLVEQACSTRMPTIDAIGSSIRMDHLYLKDCFRNSTVASSAKHFQIKRDILPRVLLPIGIEARKKSDNSRTHTDSGRASGARRRIAS